jgi:CheY-like chemotaxis protein
MSKRVLLVEDEGIVAMVVEDYLLDLGYEVVAVAARLESGMRLAQDAAIDVAILDVNLAGKLSYPIAELLYERGIPFLFATGYGNAGRPDEFRDIPPLRSPTGKTTWRALCSRSVSHNREGSTNPGRLQAGHNAAPPE